jgi:hypothetical protein
MSLAVEEKYPAPVARPAVELVEAVVESQALDLARVEREDVDVSVARAGGDEGDAPPVGRVDRARFVRRVRDEKAGLSARGRDGPDVSPGGESYLRPVGRYRGLGVVG